MGFRNRIKQIKDMKEISNQAQQQIKAIFENQDNIIKGHNEHDERIDKIENELKVIKRKLNEL